MKYTGHKYIYVVAWNDFAFFPTNLDPNSRFPWLQRPIFYESPGRAAPAEEVINNNEINNESNQVETRQMPSYADVGRFLLKRNGNY